MNATGIVTPIAALAPVESPSEMDGGGGSEVRADNCVADPPERGNDVSPDGVAEVVIGVRVRSER